MPYTSYALFKAIRSHRIDSPNFAITTESDRPNACNLCHLDRSLAWTQKTIAAWYGAKPLGSSAAEPNATETSLAAELLLAGDAADRAVAAWAFGRPEARAASGAGWEAPYLAALLDDPYSAVRFIAERSLRSFPGFSNLDYDFLALPERRRAARDAVLARFASERARIEALVARRDDRSVSISE
jgi:hypothetical protein